VADLTTPLGIGCQAEADRPLHGISTATEEGLARQLTDASTLGTRRLAFADSWVAWDSSRCEVTPMTDPSR